MRILFAHGTLAPLRSFLTGHTAREAKAEGWDTVSRIWARFRDQGNRGLACGWVLGMYLLTLVTAGRNVFGVIFQDLVRDRKSVV